MVAAAFAMDVGVPALVGASGRMGDVVPGPVPERMAAGPGMFVNGVPSGVAAMVRMRGVAPLLVPEEMPAGGAVEVGVPGGILAVVRVGPRVPFPVPVDVAARGVVGVRLDDDPLHRAVHVTDPGDAA